MRPLKPRTGRPSFAVALLAGLVGTVAVSVPAYQGARTGAGDGAELVGVLALFAVILGGLAWVAVFVGCARMGVRRPDWRAALLLIATSAATFIIARLLGVA